MPPSRLSPRHSGSAALGGKLPFAGSTASGTVAPKPVIRVAETEPHHKSLGIIVLLTAHAIKSIEKRPSASREEVSIRSRSNSDRDVRLRAPACSRQAV